MEERDGCLVKLPARLQSRGYFCLKESIRQPLGFIWLCLKEPSTTKKRISFHFHGCPNSCKKSCPIHRGITRDMSFLFSVEIARNWRLARQNSRKFNFTTSRIFDKFVWFPRHKKGSAQKLNT